MKKKKKTKCMSKAKTKGPVGSSEIFENIMHPWSQSSKRYNFFFYRGPCWIWKSMLDQSFHFVCFPIFCLGSLYVSHPLHLFFQKKLVFFALNCRVQKDPPWYSALLPPIAHRPSPGDILYSLDDEWAMGGRWLGYQQKIR